LPHTILLAGTATYPQEVLAGEADIKPGMLVTFGTGGDAGRLIKHATANGNAAAMFADVNTTPQRGTTEAIDVVYNDGETVKWFMPHRGAEVYAFVPAEAAAIVKGNLLVSNGDGTLKIFAAQASNEGGSATYTIQVQAPVAVAAEAIDNSTNTAGPVRIRVYAL
jgi:hypothetical protein